jgi:hypothetical protein
LRKKWRSSQFLDLGHYMRLTERQSSSASRRTAGAAGFFDLDPALRSAGAVHRAEPLRHDALTAELASPPVDDV